jgi:hypothetical protein
VKTASNSFRFLKFSKLEDLFPDMPFLWREKYTCWLTVLINKSWLVPYVLARMFLYE